MRNCVIHHLETLDFSGNEALNSICTNLSFVGRDMKKFAITSCTQNEGKSSMSMQIMANLARRGKRVVLVDSDLRKSVMMAHFGITMDGSDPKMQFMELEFTLSEAADIELGIRTSNVLKNGNHATSNQGRFRTDCFRIVRFTEKHVHDYSNNGICTCEGKGKFQEPEKHLHRLYR